MKHASGERQGRAVLGSFDAARVVPTATTTTKGPTGF